MKQFDLKKYLTQPGSWLPFKTQDDSIKESINVKRETYKATFSGKEYLLSFTARRLMANLRQATFDHCNAKVQDQLYPDSTKGTVQEEMLLSRCREHLVGYISDLEKDLIDLREAHALLQKRKPFEGYSDKDLLVELLRRGKVRCTADLNTSTSSSADQSESQPEGVINSTILGSTQKATPDTPDNSSARTAAESGESSVSKWATKTAVEGALHTFGQKLPPAPTVEYRLSPTIPVPASPVQSLTIQSQYLDTIRNCLIIYLTNS